MKILNMLIALTLLMSSAVTAATVKETDVLTWNGTAWARPPWQEHRNTISWPGLTPRPTNS